MAKIHGHVYKPGITALLVWMDVWPECGIMEKIWIKNNEKFFVVDN